MSQETRASGRQPKAKERRPLAYEPPRLTHLGSLREITLASNGSFGDGSGNGLHG
jgi:hypothetical protein